jgi:dCTP deaminase
MLSGQEIIKRRAAGEIHIEPFDESQVNPNSYDVRLGVAFLYNPESESKLYIPHNKTSTRTHWVEGHVSKWGDLIPLLMTKGIINDDDIEVYRSEFMKDDYIILLAPGQMILAHTMEEIGTNQGCSLTTNMFSKSSTVRNLLSVCRDGGQGTTGYKNKWTMEIKNESTDLYIPLKVGSAIAQIVFTTVIGEITPYVGKYSQSEFTVDSMRPL